MESIFIIQADQRDEAMIPAHWSSFLAEGNLYESTQLCQDPCSGADRLPEANDPGQDESYR